MSEAPLVTVVIPNWNTGPLLRICLASLCRFPPGVPHRVIVVDNASNDASRHTAEGAAAKGVIELIRRDDAKNEGAADHGAALDLGLTHVKSPLLMTLDSDAWVRKEGWFEAYRSAMGEDASHAGASKFPGGRGKVLWDRLRGKQAGPEARYVRPCHALYRTEILRQEGLSFGPYQGPEGRWRTCGERLHELLVERGHTPAFMPHATVEGLVGHLRHATFVINADWFPTLKERARRRGERKINEWLASPEAAAILEGTLVP